MDGDRTTIEKEDPSERVGLLMEILRARLELSPEVSSTLRHAIALSVHGAVGDGRTVALRLEAPPLGIILESEWTPSPGWLEAAVISAAHSLADSLEAEPELIESLE